MTRDMSSGEITVSLATRHWIFPTASRISYFSCRSFCFLWSWSTSSATSSASCQTFYFQPIRFSLDFVDLKLTFYVLAKSALWLSVTNSFRLPSLWAPVAMGSSLHTVFRPATQSFYLFSIGCAPVWSLSSPLSSRYLLFKTAPRRFSPH